MGAYSKRAFIVLSVLQTLAHQQLLCSFWLLPQLSASSLSRRSGVSPSVSSLLSLCCHCFSWFHVLIQLHPQCHAPYMGDYLRGAFIDKTAFTIGV